MPSQDELKNTRGKLPNSSTATGNTPIRRNVSRWAYYLLLTVGSIFLLGAIVFYLEGYAFQVYGSHKLRALAKESASSSSSPSSASASASSSSASATATGSSYQPHMHDVLGRLEIPRLNIFAVIVEGSDDESLKLGPGHVPGTALPGEHGNVAIAGHRNTHFLPLKEVQAGDKISVTTPRGNMEYAVQYVEIVSPDDVDAINPTDDSQLTLITCYPFFYVGSAPERFIVHAKSTIPPQEAAAKPQSPETPTPSNAIPLRSESSAVLLNVSVRNNQGDNVTDLTESDFRVKEDGQEQKIVYFKREDVPVTIGIVVDDSGSMRAKKAEVVEASLDLARSSNPQDQMFVVSFNSHVSFGLPAGVLYTSDVSELSNAFSHLNTMGKTALYDALVVAIEHLGRSPLQRKAILLISDGGDNASRHTLGQVISMADQSNAVIYTIGAFDESDDDKNPGVLKHLATLTGGQFFAPAKLSDLPGICKKIAEDIRSQYVLAYAPPSHASDTTFHKIQVSVNAPHHGKLHIRTREGYYGKSAQPQ
ncbi:MAG: VWA domain-containing protein [Candidatus Acidiferrales bacterium]|jgi:LPXTG-site transpeptidase (sortase) family protein